LLFSVAAVATAVVFCVNARRFSTGWVYFVDDPYIALRFAVNLLHHGELSFNPGQRIEGCSSLLWVLLHVLAFKITGAVPDAARAIDTSAVLSGACSLIEVILLARLAVSERRAGNDKAAAAWCWALVLTLAFWPFAFWAVAGLETTIEGCLYVAALAAVHAASRPHAKRAPWALAAILVGITLVRFEGALVVLAIGSAVVMTNRAMVRSRGGTMALVLSVVVVPAAYHLWRIAYFGNLLPNTFLANATGGSPLARLANGVSYCAGWATLLGGSLLIAALATGRRGTKSERDGALRRCARDPAAVVAAAIVGAKLLLVTIGGGDWMPGWRMLLAAVPSFFFVGARLLQESGVWSEHSIARVSPRAWLTLAAIALLAQYGQPVRRAIDLARTGTGGFRKFPLGNLAIGQLIERHFAGAPDEIAVGEAGLIPYEAPSVRFMDLFGLVDRDMALQPGVLHHRVRVAHFLERSPVAIVFAHLHHDPPYGPYQYGVELLQSARFHQSYQRVELDDTLDTLGWALYARRDGSIDRYHFRPRAHDPLALTQPAE
jgi:arabinofuranosyltransferase